MNNNTTTKSILKHIRIKSDTTQKDINFLCSEYHKTENHIINEALRFGLPLLKEHLSTDGGIKPTSNIKFQEILNILNKISRKLTTNQDIQFENNSLLLLIQAQNEIIMAMVSSIYQRQKLAWSYENEYPELSEFEESQMDFYIPHHYKEKYDIYKKSIMQKNNFEEDEE